MRITSKKNNESGQRQNAFRLFAFISLFGGAVEKAFWKYKGASLLDRTVTLAPMVRQIECIAVIADREYDLKPSNQKGVIDFIVIRPNEQWDLNSSCIPFSFMKEILNNPGIAIHNISQCHGVIFINPLFPWYTPHHFQKAIEIYASQSDRPRPWRSVVSVNVLKNQFHPKKILKIDQRGELKHFQPEGVKIYQRQQLVGDEYFVMNDALAVIDPLFKGDLLSDEGELLGYVMDSSIARINNDKNFKIVEALKGN